MAARQRLAEAHARADAAAALAAGRAMSADGMVPAALAVLAGLGQLLRLAAVMTARAAIDVPGRP